MQCRLRMRGNSSVMQRCHGSAALRQQIRTTSHTYRCSVVDGRACTDRRAHSASWVGGAGAPVASEAGAIEFRAEFRAEFREFRREFRTQSNSL